MHRSGLRTGAAIVVTTAAVLAAVLLAAGSASAAAWPDGPWTGSGTATTTVTSDGTTSDPVLDYSVNGQSGSWTFANTAKTARKQSIAWRYKGYHAWFMVSVKIEQFVIRAGQETATTLRSAGTVNCCKAPSGGFDYTGTAEFDLQPGDVYGFRMSGSNSDRDRRLIGTLSLSIPPHPPTCATTNGTDTPIPDARSQVEPGTVTSSITVTGCPGNALAATSVEVHIVHQYSGDLEIVLIAPDGTEYPLKPAARANAGYGANVDQTYTVNASSEQANGTWKLRVSDCILWTWYTEPPGHIDSWTISP